MKTLLEHLEISTENRKYLWRMHIKLLISFIGLVLQFIYLKQRKINQWFNFFKDLKVHFSVIIHSIDINITYCQNRWQLSHTNLECTMHQTTQLGPFQGHHIMSKLVFDLRQGDPERTHKVLVVVIENSPDFQELEAWCLLIILSYNLHCR